MATHDYNIANADGATVRADINSVLEAVATNNSSSTAPPVTFPYMFWFDTSVTPGKLKQRNGANTAWIDFIDDSEVATSTGDQALAEALDQRGPVFDSVADMEAAAGLTVGVKCKTLGYSFIGDGGGNEYEIVAAATGTDDGGSFVDLSGSGHQAKGLFPKGVVTPEMFGATVDGSTDNSAETNAAAAYVRSSGGTLVLGAKTYVGEGLDLDDIDIECNGKGRTKLLHKASSTTNLIDVTTSLTLRDLTIDGNRANRTDRDAGSIQVASGKVFVSDIDFKSSIRAGINGDNTLDELVVRDCRFYDMEEHSGTFGDSTAGIRFNGPVTGARIHITGCHFDHTVINADRVPGGIFILVDDAQVFVSENYFRNIGQRTDDGGNANFLGCVDLYQNADRAVITNNIFENYYYTPLKLQNCSNIVASGNVIKGNADASASTAILWQNARDFQEAMIYCSIANNTIDLSGQSITGIAVSGDPDDTISMSRVNVTGNVIDGASRGVNVDYASEASITGNTVSRCDISFRLAFEPTTLTGVYSYGSNTSINPASRHMLFDMSAVSDAWISITGNTMVGQAGTHTINLNNFQNASITGNTMSKGSTNFVNVDNGTNVTIVGNAGETSTGGVTSGSVTKVVDANNSWN